MGVFIISVLLNLLLTCVCLLWSSDIMLSDDTNAVRLAAWNCRGIKGAGPYMQSLMKRCDVIALSEHKLYEAELGLLNEISSEFQAFGRSSEDLSGSKYGYVPGHCGVALLWRNSIASQVKPLPNLGTDRICAIQLCLSGQGRRDMFIVSVYMPQSKCVISNYQDHVDVLYSIIDVCSRDGDVVIVGDWNAHFGEEFGGRAWGKTSKNAKLASVFIEESDMCIVDLLTSCEGPVYTYCGENGSVSYIDHCILPKILVNECTVCKVLEDEPENTSDHLAIYVELCIKLTGRRIYCKPKDHTSWNRVTKSGVNSTYTTPLEDSIKKYVMYDYPTSNPSEWSTQDIDGVYNDIVTMIRDVDSRLPKVKHGAGVKHYWTDTLSELVKLKKSAWKHWTEQGRPRDSDNAYWQAYKESKRLFRCELRRQSNQEDVEFAQQIDSAGEVNQELFWRLVNRKRKRKASQVRPFQKADGSMATDISAIREAWGDYYEDLYTPKDLGYNETFRESVEAAIGRIDLTPHNDSILLREPITREEVAKTIKQLKSKKAPGPDSVQPEHIKLGGNSLVQVLTDLFNAMICKEYRPANLKRGLIVPIPKGRKDSSVPDNNRGITLTSVIGKLYDNILVHRSSEWLQKVTDDLQGAKHKHCSCKHTAMLLRETVACSREDGRSVYTALLDVRKAFDQVWIDGLFYKLMKMEMDPKLWRILRDAYDNFQCAVLIAGDTSRCFIPRQGIHQGDVWSMPLYCVYNNDLLKELKASPYGVKLCTINCTCPTFVDDLTILAWSKHALNICLSIASRYSRTWRFQFGAAKSFFLNFGKDTDPGTNVMIGNNTINSVERHTHVGVPVCTSKGAEKKAIDERLSATMQVYNTIKAICSPPGMMNPATMSKLYWSLCVPKMTYGMEVWPISIQSNNAMEKVHNHVAKCIQGLPEQTSDPACHATLGWRTIESHVDVVSLMFLWQLLSLPVFCIYNQIVISRITDFRFGRRLLNSETPSPIGNLYRIATKYGLTEAIHNMLDTGHMPPRNKWRSIVNSAVSDLQVVRWRMSCLMYKKLSNLMMYVPEPFLVQWWHVCKSRPDLTKKCKAIISLIVGEHNLGCGKGKFTNNSKLCQLCDYYVEESIPHFLLECPGLKSTRTLLLSRVWEAMPPAMVQSLADMTNQKQTDFLLGEMGSTHVSEWCTIHQAIIVLVHGLRKERENVLSLK